MNLLRPQPTALPPTPLAPAWGTRPSSQPAIDQRSFFQVRTRSESGWHHRIIAWSANLRLSLIELAESNLGLLLIATAQLFMAMMNTAVKVLDGVPDPVPTLEFITYFCSLVYMIVRKIPHPVLGPPGVRSLLVARGVFGFFGLFGLYYSLQYLSLSDAIVLTFLSPTTTALAGFLFLRESLSRKEICAGLLSFLGVVLIAQPQTLFGPPKAAEQISEFVSETGGPIDSTTATQRLIAVGVAMLGVVGSTGAYISLRAVGTRAHALHSLAFFSSYSVIVSTAGMIVFRVKPVVPKRWTWCALLTMVGVCGFIGQVLLVMGLQRETASRGTMALYVQIIFATIFERLVFKLVPSYLSVLGTVIIVGSAIYVVLNKDTTRDAYKRIPRQVDDLESHELDDAPGTPGAEPSIEGTHSMNAVPKTSPSNRATRVGE